MQVCNLHGLEVARLEAFTTFLWELYGPVPTPAQTRDARKKWSAPIQADCRTHDHLRRVDAEQLVAAGLARWVNGAKRRAVTATRLATDRGYELAAKRKDDLGWAPAKSGGGDTGHFSVLQLVHAPRRRSARTRLKQSGRSGARSGPGRIVTQVEAG